jgi:hypothetical protein
MKVPCELCNDTRKCRITLDLPAVPLSGDLIDVTDSRGSTVTFWVYYREFIPGPTQHTLRVHAHSFHPDAVAFIREHQ